MLGGRIDYRFGKLVTRWSYILSMAFSNEFQPTNVYDISGDNFSYSAALII